MHIHSKEVLVWKMFVKKHVNLFPYMAISFGQQSFMCTTMVAPDAPQTFGWF